MKHIDKLNKLSACGSAVREASKFNSGQKAWDNSVRGDWMLWLVGKTSGKPESKKRKKLVLCACECARLALIHVPKGELRPLKAIETAEAWTRGEATIEEVRVARRAYAAAAYAAAAYAAYAADAAYAAYAAAAYAAAAYAAADTAAYAAAYAADAAYAAADAAYAAADTAAYAAADAADAAAKRKTLKQCADIVRKHYPKVPVVKL